MKKRRKADCCGEISATKVRNWCRRGGSRTHHWGELSREIEDRRHKGTAEKKQSPTPTYGVREHMAEWGKNPGARTWFGSKGVIVRGGVCGKGGEEEDRTGEERDCPNRTLGKKGEKPKKRLEGKYGVIVKPVPIASQQGSPPNRPVQAFESAPRSGIARKIMETTLDTGRGEGGQRRTSAVKGVAGALY